MKSGNFGPNQTIFEILREHQAAMTGMKEALTFFVATDIALLGFGRLEDAPGLLVTFSLMVLLFAHGFWFLNSRLLADSIWYESRLGNAPQDDAHRTLIRRLDHRNAIAANLTVVTAFMAAAFLFTVLLDQFIDSELVQSLPSILAIVIFVAIFFSCAVTWLILWLSWSSTVSKFAVST
jgi:hypothetical protein